MNIEEALKRLGFTAEWLEFGVITKEYLGKLYSEILTSEDQNAEHYRGWAFSEYLMSKKTLSDQDIMNIFKLKDNGPDNCDLHEGRLISLLHSELLTDFQLEELSMYPELSQRPLQKLFFRKRMVRAVKSNGVDYCFPDITEANDPDVNDYVIQREDIKLAHINWFSENASNKRIRNIAKQMKKSRRYSDSV